MDQWVYHLDQPTNSLFDRANVAPPTPRAQHTKPTHRPIEPAQPTDPCTPSAT
jgi:hypothetical protein